MTISAGIANPNGSHLFFNRRWKQAAKSVVKNFDQIPQLEGQRTAFDRLFF